MTTDLTHRRGMPEASYSVASIIAIVCAIAAWVVSAGWSILLAIVAIIAGLIGAAAAISPNKRGGVMSIIAILIGLIAIVVSIIALIFRVLT